MIVVAAVAGALLAAVAIFAASRSRQNGDAIGVLSRETRARDIAGSSLGDESELTGRQVEKAAALERKNARQELVLVAKGAPPRRSCRPIRRPSASRVVSSSIAASS